MSVRTKSRVTLSLVAATFLAVAVMASGSWFAVTRGVDQALEENAKITASEWAVYLAGALPQIEGLLEGEPLNSDSRQFLEKAQVVGKIFRYKLFDSSGVLRLDSFDLNAGEDASLAAHNPSAAEVVLTGQPHMEFKRGDGISRPLYYAEAYYPLVIDGRTIGTIEVYVDQTGRTQQLNRQFLWTAIIVATISAFGFLLPALAFLQRTREKAAADEALAHAARHDALTGLLNRFEFRTIVERRIAAEPNRAMHILFIDLDRFKDVNDTRGHAIGDDLLRQVADRLREVAGMKAYVCRLGGDEFAIFDPDGVSVRDAVRLAERVVRALAKPFPIKTSELVIGASVGIAEYPSDGMNSSDLLRSADLALYEAKRRGRGVCCVFEPAMEEERAKRMRIEQRLRRAVDEDDFNLAYQPLYQLSEGRLAGFEALLRLDDDDGQPISPGVFLPIAEESGLIIPLGRLVLQRACRTAMLWPENLYLAVNLSPVQFENGKLAATVKGALEKSGLPAARLELEVTESILLNNPDMVALQLDHLKELGISIALDDFGTGYSSLSYLWKFPFNKLKIDRSFISSLSNNDNRSRQVLKTVVALGEVLRLGITAEGVETSEQAEEIRSMHIDFVQGFYYGRPTPSEDLDEAIPLLMAAAQGQGQKRAASA